MYGLASIRAINDRAYRKARGLDEPTPTEARKARGATRAAKVSASQRLAKFGA